MKVVGHKTVRNETKPIKKIKFPPGLDPVRRFRRREEIALQKMKKDFIVLFVEKNIPFLHSAVINVIKAIFGIDFDSISSGHDPSITN